MNGYQPKKTCDDCLLLHVCKTKRDKQACDNFKPLLPPPPPPKYIPPASAVKQKEKKSIVVIKVKAFLPDMDAGKIRKKFLEQAKTGVVIIDSSVDVFNVSVEDDIAETEVKVEIIR